MPPASNLDTFIFQAALSALERHRERIDLQTAEMRPAREGRRSLRREVEEAEVKLGGEAADRRGVDCTPDLGPRGRRSV
jgi:hypothetical protein